MILEDQGVILMIIGNDCPTATNFADNQLRNHAILSVTIIFYPQLLEVTLGEIISITNFGAFVRIGPLDDQVFLSRIFDGKSKCDAKSQTITASAG